MLRRTGFTRQSAERACVRPYILLIGLAGMAVGISKHFFHRIKTTWSSNEQ